MQPLSGDATSALLRALGRRVGKGVAFRAEEIVSRPWASATFTGARHEISFRLEGEQAESAASAFAEGLQAAEFALRGHILADILIVDREPAVETAGGTSVRLRIEALTVEVD